MADSIECLKAQDRRMAEREADLQKRLTAARGEFDAVEAAGEAEEKRKALYSEILSLRQQLEQAQFDLAFVRQRLIAAESGTEAAREFPTRIFVRI
jgi:hypothetical protein